MAFSIRKVFQSRSKKAAGTDKRTGRRKSKKSADTVENAAELAQAEELSQEDLITGFGDDDPGRATDELPAEDLISEDLGIATAGDTAEGVIDADEDVQVVDETALLDETAPHAGDSGTKLFSPDDSTAERSSTPFDRSLLEDVRTAVDSASDRVGTRVDRRSTEVQETVRDAASSQNSVIQGIYRLIDERTTDRAGLNKRRREVWKTLKDSLAEIREEISGLNTTVMKDSAVGVPSTGALEELVAAVRKENRDGVARVENAISDLRDDQWHRIEAMVAELRTAEKERVDKVLEALHTESDKRVAELKHAGETRVFDAVRSGDQRVAAQKEILQRKITELEEIYQQRAGHLETVFKKQTEALRSDNEVAEERHAESRQKVLLQQVSFYDTLDHRLRVAHSALSVRERNKMSDALDMSESQERRVSFVRRFLGKKDLERFEAERAELEERLRTFDGDVIEAQKARVEGLDDLRGLLLISLKCEGVEPFTSLGEDFQPHRHVCAEEVPVKAGQKSGTVVQVRRSGFLLDGEVLRPAEVVVAK